MTKEEAIKLLAEHQNERGIAVWERSGLAGKSFGLGVTTIKKLAKQVGKNHELALELWDTDIFDAKVLSTLVEEPKKVTREQVQSQIHHLNFWMLTNAYCNYMLHKVKFFPDLVDGWTQSEHEIERICGYLMLGQLVKKDKKREDAYFERYIDLIEGKLQTEANFVKDAMNTALLAMGMRNTNLHTRALAAAKQIGKVEVDYGDNSCQALDCVKHLQSERVQKKLMKA